MVHQPGYGGERMEAPGRGWVPMGPHGSPRALRAPVRGDGGGAFLEESANADPPGREEPP